MQKVRRIRTILSGIILALLFSSCMETINLDDLRPDPKLVLNCAAIGGQPVSAYLSRTWFYTDEKPNIAVGNAEVQLYVNDVFQEKMEITEDTTRLLGSCYRSVYCPRPGDRLEVKASADGFSGIRAQTDIPETPVIENVTIIHEHNISHNEWDNTKYYFCKDSIALTFRDVPAVGNHYLLYLKEAAYFNTLENGDTVYVWKTMYPDFGDEPLFASQISAIDRILGNDEVGFVGGIAFSDEQINGMAYTLHMKNEYVYSEDSNSSDGGYGQGGGYEGGYQPSQELHHYKYKVYFYSISSAYYNYLKTLEAFRNSSFTGDLAGVGLAEPITTYSNVVGGTGFLGGTSVPRFFELTGKD